MHKISPAQRVDRGVGPNPWINTQMKGSVERGKKRISEEMLPSHGGGCIGQDGLDTGEGRKKDATSRERDNRPCDPVNEFLTVRTGAPGYNKQKNRQREAHSEKAGNICREPKKCQAHYKDVSAQGEVYRGGDDEIHKAQPDE